MGLSNFQIQRKKAILTSPKLFEFHKKLENSPQRHFGARKNSYFVLGYRNVVFIEFPVRANA